MHRETEDRVECRHWVETPVEPEHKFVEVSLQVLMTNSVMRAEQPSLQIREGDVDHRQVCIRSLRVTIKHQGLVRVTQLGQIIVALPTVGVHNSALCHSFSHEPRESLGTAVWHKAQSQSARADGFLGLFAIGAGRPWAYLDGSNDRRLMVDAVSLALCTAANKRLIHFDRILGSDSVALGSHHAGAQLVEHLKSCLVAGHAQLPLKLQSRLAGRLCRHKVSPQEPYRQRHVTAHHDGARHERHVGLAGAASQDDRSSLGEAVWLTDISAFHARKPDRPPQVLKVSCAGRVIGEYPLKFGERHRKTTGVHAGNLTSDHRFGNQPDRQRSMGRRTSVAVRNFRARLPVVRYHLAILLTSHLRFGVGRNMEMRIAVSVGEKEKARGAESPYFRALLAAGAEES